LKTGDVRGTRVTAASLEEATNDVLAMASGAGGVVCLANVHIVETARRSPELAEALADADLVLPDGAPVAWALRRAGLAAERVAGSDLLASVLTRTRERSTRHFFLGSTNETLGALIENVLALYPGVRIAGSHAPPFMDAVHMDVSRLGTLIEAADSNVVWVGLGAPKQELLMMRLRPHTRAALVGVGAVFDFASGQKARAPELMQRLGLEWLHRLVREPRRLGRRYFETNSSFVWWAIATSLSRRGRAA